MLGDVEGVSDTHYTKCIFLFGQARDTGPTFVRSKYGVVRNVWVEGDDAGVGFQGRTTEGETVAMLLNFTNGGGNRALLNSDMYFAATVAEILDVPAVLAPFGFAVGLLRLMGRGRCWLLGVRVRIS